MGSKGSVLRGHMPVVKEEFNGLFIRGDPEACPPDHEPDNQNVMFSQSAVETRDGLDIYEAYPTVTRIYTYTYNVSGTVPQESLLILDGNGNIFHDKSPTPFNPILSIAGMTDFGFIAWDGRAYINPCQGVHGLTGQSIYVYKGDGTPARKAGGAGPAASPGLGLSDGGTGDVEAGVHVLAVAFETDTGFITQIGAFASYTAAGGHTVNITGIPVSSDPFVVARRLVATIAIDPKLFTGNLKDGYEFFFIPDGRIADNTTTTHTSSFFDSELLEDASYLLNLFTNIPAGVGFATYHNRLISYAEQANQSVARVSYVGQPEAFDQVSGLLITPVDNLALTNGQAFRDVLYLFKSARTFGYNDNGDVPSSWPLTVIDEGIGASVHGVAQVLDSGGVNIDYLIIIDFSGIMLFNGSYIRPELTWKIRDYWFTLTRTNFLNIQIMNDSISQRLYVTLPNQQMLFADYSNGMNAKEIRYAKWKFNVQTTTITLINYNTLIIGSVGPAS